MNRGEVHGSYSFVSPKHKRDMQKEANGGGRGIINLPNTGPKKGAQVETCFWPYLQAQNAKQRALQ